MNNQKQMLDRGNTASAIKNVSTTYVPRDMSLCLFLSRSGCPKLLTIDNKCRGPVLSLQPFPARSQEQRPVHASRRYPACNGRAPICPKIKRIRAAGRMPRPLPQCTKRCKAGRAATAACAPNGKKVAKIAMPRGSKPGERRGGRQPGTPNKTTALINTAFAATTSNPGLSPLDFFFGRDERSVDTARLALQGRPGCRALRPPQTRTRSSGRSRGDF